MEDYLAIALQGGNVGAYYSRDESDAPDLVRDTVLEDAIGALGWAGLSVAFGPLLAGLTKVLAAHAVHSAPAALIPVIKALKEEKDPVKAAAEACIEEEVRLHVVDYLKTALAKGLINS